MAEGVDYSFSSPSPAGLAAAGKRFAGRYIGPGSGKFLTPTERDALFAAGLDIFLLVEGSADSAAGGYNVGVAHALSGLAHARALGAPESVALYFAVDYDVSSKGWDGPREYLRGAGSVIGPGRVGVYGERDVMAWAQRDRVAAWFFQTYAWSGGQWFAGNHVEQYHNGVIVAGGEVDLCRSMATDFGQWSTHQLPPEEEDVTAQVLVRFGDAPAEEGGPGQVWLADGMLRRKVPADLASGDSITDGGIGNNGTHIDGMLGELGNGGQTFVSAWSARDAWGQDVATIGHAGGGSTGGGGPTLAQITAAMRAELDATKLGKL